MNFFKSKFSIFLLAFGLLTATGLFYPASYIASTSSPACQSESTFGIFKPAVDSLLKKGVDSAFIMQILQDENTVFNEKYVKINVTGYLTSTDYSHFYNDKSIKKNVDFINENIALLQAAEKQYDIPKEAIAAILWVETKHGSYLGNNQLPSVFLSTSLVNLQKYIDLNISSIDSTKYSKKEYEALIKKVYQRSERKSKWAIQELVAMSKARKKYSIDFTKVYGSWAGAFGMSQFLPSSFLQWAVDGNNDGKIDLFSLEDAVFSVANYLKSHGWNKDNSKAVYAYNNSKAYVNAVLTLYQKIS